MDCAELGGQIEMYLRGALEADAAPVVEAHLADCADCRDYVERVRRIEVEMNAALEPDAIAHQRLEAHWQVVQAAIARRQRGAARVRSWAWMPIVCALSCPFAPGLGSFSDRAVAAGTCALLAALFWCVPIAERSKYAHLAQRRGSLIRWMRGVTHAELAVLLFVIAGFGGAGVYLAAVAATHGDLIIQGRLLLAGFAIALALTAAVSARMVPRTWRTLRELR